MKKAVIQLLQVFGTSQKSCKVLKVIACSNTSIKPVFNKALQNFLKRFSLKKISFVLNNSYTNTSNTGV